MNCTQYLTKEEISFFSTFVKTLDNNLFYVWPWYEASSELTDRLDENGGDEDWLIIVKKELKDKYYPFWLDKTDSCDEPNVYEIDDFYIFVGKHA